MNTAQAVQHVLDTEGISKYRLAKSLGAPTSSVYQWLGQTRMSTLYASKFKELYNIEIKDVYEPLLASDRAKSTMHQDNT